MSRLAMAVCLLFATSFAAAEIPEPEVVQVNDRVYALIGPMGLPDASNHGYMVNSTLILGEEGAVLIDTGFTDKIGEHLKQTIAEITDKPVTHVINTHHHGDHTLGNIAFSDAEFLSAEMCRKLLDETGHDWVGIIESMTGMEFPDTEPVLADTTYPTDSRTEVTLQGVRLQMWVPTAAHTEGDMMVYLPDDKILVAGDVLVNEVTPNFQDGKVAEWVATLDDVVSLDAETIIPGHGPLMEMADAQTMHRMMAEFYEGVEAAYLDGAMSSEIRDRVDLSEWEKLKNFEENMGGNISRTYLEVEMANF